MTQTITNLLDRITEIQSAGKEVVFDCDQVLMDHGQLNIELLDALKAKHVVLKIYSHGCTYHDLDGKYDYTVVQYKNNVVMDDDDMPMLNEHDMPVITKECPSNVVLIDDRAIEWERWTGKHNFIQYKWIA